MALYIDAHERVSEALGQAPRQLVTEPTSRPSTCRCGITLRARLKFLFPGYTAPQLLKTCQFHFNTRLHSGAAVDGRCIEFPANLEEMLECVLAVCREKRESQAGTPAPRAIVDDSVQGAP